MAAIERYINTQYLSDSVLGRRLLPGLAAVLVLAALWITFMVVPTERVMGAVQRVFYFHVASAMACYAMIVILLVSSSFYLATRKKHWDFAASAAARVSFLFATIVLLTGSIWGHSAWNTWWRWEPRLVSFLILWLLLLAYVLLASFGRKQEQAAQFAAVLGILIALNVPIVIFSIKLLSHAEQLHPEVVATRGLKDARFYLGMIVSNLALIVTSVWFWWIAVTERVVAERLREIRISVAMRD